jgi:fructose-bisphosphate aldolase class I
VEGLLLKTNMVLSGVDCPDQAGASQVAAMTLCAMRRAVPAAVPGILFLSGGQTEAVATNHLRLLNQSGTQPWALSFSFGRALQASALKAWNGNIENVPAAQEALLYRARCNSAACYGKLPEQIEDMIHKRMAA